ncbi:MAG: hypothetical protein MUC87_21645 [Bacteroidia bacterium]|nr:hypothetical protein [Bacteroidia bacterium]
MKKNLSFLKYQTITLIFGVEDKSMLSIQKVIVLLDEFHLQEFRKYLEESKAELPLRLVDSAVQIGWEEKDSDELCKAIYKKADTQAKKKFFQLAHHTFKLTGYLSRNYPTYLAHNVSAIERFVNQGKLREANKLAEILLDVAEKIEDFATARAVLQFFAQQVYIREKKTEAIRYLERNAEVIDAEMALNDIYLYMRRNLHFKDKSALGPSESDKHIAHFVKYHNHWSFAVRIMSRYAACYTLHFFNDERYYEKQQLDELNTLSDELEKSPYVIFSFSDDVEMNIDYLKLKSMMSIMDPDTLQKEAAVLLKKRETPRFWRNYLNTAQIAFLSIQGSALVSRYGFGYRKGWNESLPQDIKDQLNFYRSTAEEILANVNWDEESLHVRYINSVVIYCCFLLMGTREDIRKVIDTIENMLFNYQQVAFHRMYDQIFAALIMAYFMLEDYIKVQECYKRYEKLTANSTKLQENDITIKAYYYVAQWLQSGRKQYKDKLEALIVRTEGVANLETTRYLLNDLKSYYKI